MKQATETKKKKQKHSHAHEYWTLNTEHKQTVKVPKLETLNATSNHYGNENWTIWISSIETPIAYRISHIIRQPYFQENQIWFGRSKRNIHQFNRPQQIHLRFSRTKYRAPTTKNVYFCIKIFTKLMFLMFKCVPYCFCHINR